VFEPKKIPPGGSGALHRDLFCVTSNLDKSRPGGVLPMIYDVTRERKLAKLDR
jgi:hypothetical protein